jgi:TrpR-related protein YerC/YecD
MKKSGWNNKHTAELIAAILMLKDKTQATNFLRDLLTEKELIEFGNRWKAARMLAKNESYKDIIEKTGLSSRTVARIQKWLTAGAGGYRSIISKLEK